MNRMDGKYAVSPVVEWAESDGEIMVVELEQGQVYSLNNVASVIWQGIATGLSIGQIVEYLKQEFDVPEVTLQSDVLGCVDSLLAKQLVAIQCD